MSSASSDTLRPLTIGDDICTPDFWRSLAPGLHIGELARGDETVPHQTFERLARRMARDGYFQERDETLLRAAPGLVGAIQHIVSLGLPPVLVWLFDEPWECFRRLSPVISHFLGRDYRCIPSFWAWHVDPAKGEGGWAPHRDNSRGLAPDGSPLSLTCWIPLTDANPLNSCMYIVPAHLDPQLTGSPELANAATPPPRALPAKPGDYLIWNQVVLHWGGASSEFAEAPRISIALEFQRGDAPPFRRPLIDPSSFPTFRERMSLIAVQIRQFTHMYKWSDEILQLASKLEAASGA